MPIETDMYDCLSTIYSDWRGWLPFDGHVESDTLLRDTIYFLIDWRLSWLGVNV